MMKYTSIVIVTFNGKEYVDRCVDSIWKSKTKNLEVVVVDNGSTDGTVNFLKKKYAKYVKDGRFSCIGLDRNYGPAMARNVGVKNSRGKYIGFLDNDTVVDPHWASEAINEFESDSALGVVQCKLLIAKQKEVISVLKTDGRYMVPNKKGKKYLIDYVGEFIGQNGFLVQRCLGGEEYDRGQFDQKVEILAAKSAGMFITREAFESVGGFDGDYFIYVEETDLGWRCWLKGYRAIYLSTSVVFHEFGTSALALGKERQNYHAKFHGCKNYILTLMKNLEAKSVFKILPIHVLLWLGLAWYILFLGQKKSFWWIHKAIGWHVVNIVSTLKKRKLVQRGRKISDDVLFGKIMKKMSWQYYLSKGTTNKKVGNAESFMVKR